MDRATLARIKADPHLTARVLRMCEPVAERPTLRDPSALLAVARAHLDGRESEALVCIAVDRRLAVIDSAVLTVGSDAYSIVDVRQILRWVLTRSRPSHGFALAHNHPSGDPSPSHEDTVATNRIKGAATVVGLTFLDHVIVTDGPGFYSFAQSGNL